MVGGIEGKKKKKAMMIETTNVNHEQKKTNGITSERQ